MPLSHFAKINPDYDEKDENSEKFKEGGKNLWILKPVGLNRGQGIHVVNSIKKCKKLIREYCFGREVEAPSKNVDAVQEACPEDMEVDNDFEQDNENVTEIGNEVYTETERPVDDSTNE